MIVGTSACVNGNFYCANLGDEPRLLNSSFVDDGVCGAWFCFLVSVSVFVFGVFIKYCWISNPVSLFILVCTPLLLVHCVAVISILGVCVCRLL